MEVLKVCDLTFTYPDVSDALSSREPAFTQEPAVRKASFSVANGEFVVLCGRSADVGSDTLTRFPALADLRVLSPSRPKEWLAARREGKPVRVFCGELAASCPAEDVEGLTVLPGVADYLPDWPRLAFGR